LGGNKCHVKFVGSPNVLDKSNIVVVGVIYIYINIDKTNGGMLRYKLAGIFYKCDESYRNASTTI
jgi:hypothetical protein